MFSHGGSTHGGKPAVIALDATLARTLPVEKRGRVALVDPQMCQQAICDDAVEEVAADGPVVDVEAAIEQIADEGIDLEFPAPEPIVKDLHEFEPEDEEELVPGEDEVRTCVDEMCQERGFCLHPEQQAE